jgi:hypothetical protein
MDILLTAVSSREFFKSYLLFLAVHTDGVQFRLWFLSFLSVSFVLFGFLYLIGVKFALCDFFGFVAFQFLLFGFRILKFR